MKQPADDRVDVGGTHAAQYGVLSCTMPQLVETSQPAQRVAGAFQREQAHACGLAFDNSARSTAKHARPQIRRVKLFWVKQLTTVCATDHTVCDLEALQSEVSRSRKCHAGVCV